MKKAIFIFILIVFSLLYYAGVLTRKETLPFSKEFFSVETSSAADRPWDVRKIPSWNKKELDQLYQLKLDRGIRNLPLLSFVLIRESEQARRNGATDQAMEMANYSIRFSPDLPQPYFELARVYWHQNPLQLHKVFPAVFQGQVAQFQYYPSSLRLYYNTFYILSNAVLMTFIVFGIVIMVKFLPLYFYDIRKNLSQEISTLILNSLKIFVLFVPFFLRLDILWAILFWSILLWGYVTKKERQFVLLFLIILVYLPFFLHTSSTFLDGRSSDVILEMNQMNHEDWDKGAEERLKAWLSAHPNDPDVLFTLGLIEKRRGRYPQAVEYYERAIHQDNKFSEAYSNLGNVYLAQKQTSLATASYQKAIDLSPGKGAYFYNLYRAYSQETFLSGKIDRTFQKARQLDPRLIDYYSTIDSPNINRLVIDEVLANQRFWERFLNEFIGPQGFLFRLFKAWFEKIPSRVPLLAPIVFLGFLMGMSRYSRTKRFLTRCPMCGSPTYRFYLGNSAEEFICFNCYRIFIQKEKLHPKIAEKKKIQVLHFQKQNHFVSRFLSFFFAGYGFLWTGQAFKGFLFLFLFFVFILRIFYWNGVITTSFVPPPPTLWSAIVWGGLFILFYFLSIRQVLRLKTRFDTEK